MLFTDLKNMYIGTGKKNKSKIFIVANSIQHAQDTADKYSCDEKLDETFVIEPFPSSANDLLSINFSHDRPVTATESEISEYAAQPNIERCGRCKRLFDTNQTGWERASSTKGPNIRYRACPHCGEINDMSPDDGS